MHVLCGLCHEPHCSCISGKIHFIVLLVLLVTLVPCFYTVGGNLSITTIQTCLFHSPVRKLVALQDLPMMLETHSVLKWSLVILKR